jgi:hypothetical protein
MLIGSDKRKGNERERKRGGLAGLREDSWEYYWEEARAEINGTWNPNETQVGTGDRGNP